MYGDCLDIYGIVPEIYNIFLTYMVSFMRYTVYFMKSIVCCSIAVLDPPAWYAKEDMPWVKRALGFVTPLCTTAATLLYIA